MQPVKYRRIVLSTVALLSFLSLLAQEAAYLQRKITLTAVNQPLFSIFNTIERQTNLVFSYNPRQFNDQRKFSASYVNTPLHVVMEEILKETSCSYKLRKNYLILSCTGKKEPPSPPPIVITGYLYDKRDSSAIMKGSVYIASAKLSAFSDSSGYFRLLVPPQKKGVLLSVAKERYRDTAFVLLPPLQKNMLIYLSSFQQPVVLNPLTPAELKDAVPLVQNDTAGLFRVPDQFIRSLLIREKVRLNMFNITDTLFSSFSFSLVPPISTNKLLSINTVNKVALNLLVGYSKGIQYVEVGGLFNIDRGRVSYVQVAGLANLVTDHVTGFQVGGLFNSNGETTTGVQVAGLVNQSQSMEGLQIGGIFNRASRYAEGMQVGGIANVSDSIKGVQLAGIVNHARVSKGVQLAGIVNNADTLKGMQLAGIINCAKKISGFQMAGLINYSGHAAGSQLAFLNIADTCTGIPFGFLSFVRRGGYHKLELSVDDLVYTTIGFRTGVAKFHTIFFAGLNVSSSPYPYTYGYGIGSAFVLKNRWSLLTELSAQQLHRSNDLEEDWNLLNKLFVAMECRISKRFSLGIGPTCNLLLRNATLPLPSFPFTGSLSSSSFYKHTSGTTSLYMWAGSKISIKFF